MPPDEAQQAPEETQETPEVEAPEEGTPSPQEVDWEGRYKNAQAEMTRATQEAAEYRQIYEALNSDDVELRNAAREALGLPLEEVQQEEEPDPYDQRLTKLEQAILQSQEAQQADQQRQQLVDYIDGKLMEIEGQRGLEFTDPEVKAIVAQAERLVDDNGMPDVGAAVDLLDEIDKVRSERRVTSKKAAQVQTGTAGEKKWNRRDPAERTARMAEIMSSQEEAS